MKHIPDLVQKVFDSIVVTDADNPIFLPDNIPIDEGCSPSCGKYVLPATMQGVHAFDCPNVERAWQEHQRERMLRTNPVACRNLEVSPF